MKFEKVRRRVYQLLEKAQAGDVWSLIIDVFILSLIFFNILAIMFETVESIHLKYSTAFKIFDLISVIIFTIEYILRIWVSVERDDSSEFFKKRVKYGFSFMAIVDLLAILPFYLAFLPIDMRFLRTIRLLRIIRIFKIGHYSNSLGTLGRIFKKKKADLFIGFFITVILLVVFANIIFFVEHNAQPDVFSNVFQSMWWGIITITSVGYGDMYPITTLGKFLGGLISFLGILIIAIPIGILGAAYVEDMDNKQKGKIRSIHTEDHIIICGYTQITPEIIKDLLAENIESKIILITKKLNPDIPGIIYVNADWTDLNVLKLVSIETAATCVIMAENIDITKGNADDVIDMNTIFTLYKIKQNFPNIHTVVELINPDRLEMIKSNLKGDEIILKEIIDGNMVANCVKFPQISNLLYEILNPEGKIIKETSLEQIGLKDFCKYEEVIKFGIEKDITFIGFIRGEHNISQLSPSKNVIVNTTDRLIFIAERNLGILR